MNREQAHQDYAVKLTKQIDLNISDRDLFQSVIDHFDGQPYCKTWEDYLFITRKARENGGGE